MLINGAGIFVPTLAAVVAGGFINNILHHPSFPELEPKPGATTTSGRSCRRSQRKSREKREEGREETLRTGRVLFHRSAAGGEFSSEGRQRALPADRHGCHGARDPEIIANVQKHSPMIRNNRLLLISNRDYQKLATT